MAGETQQAFMARVRKALADRGAPTTLPDDLEVARVIRRGQDLVGVFAARAMEAGMHPHRVSDTATAVDKVVELVIAASARSVLIPDEQMPGRAEIAQRLAAAEIVLADPNDPDAAFEADIGITAARTAVAETASIAVVSGDGHRRLASLAVPTHIAIITADQIVPDLLDWGNAAPAEMPANEVLISASSKTADIEMILVPGVHGPGVVHLVIIE